MSGFVFFKNTDPRRDDIRVEKRPQSHCRRLQEHLRDIGVLPGV